MADKAKTRKAPVRTAPARKDYPSEIAWLHAKLEHAQAEQTKVNEAKVARLDKRLAALKTEYLVIAERIDKLARERDLLAFGDSLTSDDQPPTFVGVPADEV
jgi:hypothetical protein